jgi:hypothetical protein
LKTIDHDQDSCASSESVAESVSGAIVEVREINLKFKDLVLSKD